MIPPCSAHQSFRPALPGHFTLPRRPGRGYTPPTIPAARMRRMSLAYFLRESPRAAKRLFLVLLLAVFAAVSVQYTLKMLEPRDGNQTRSAILRWREQLLKLDDGVNIYAENNYPNPPIMAILLRPLANL